MKNDTLPFATTRIDLEGIMLSDISQIEKDECHTLLLIRGLRKTKQTNRTETDSQSRQRADGRRVGAGLGGRGAKAKGQEVQVSSHEPVTGM